MRSKKIAVFLHLYNTELAEYFLDYLLPVKDMVKVYITLPDKGEYQEVKDLLSPLEPTFEHVANVGTDILPFLKLLNKYGKKHTYFLKIHSKKSLRDMHASWLSILMHELVGSKQTFKDNLTTLETNKELVAIGPASCLMNNEACHDIWIDYLMAEMKIPQTHRSHFIAGTMFMGRIDPFIKYFNKNVAEWLERLMIKKGEVAHVKDWSHSLQRCYTTYVHCMERIFGYIGDVSITEPKCYLFAKEQNLRRLVITKDKEIYDVFNSQIFGNIVEEEENKITIIWQHKRPRIKEVYKVDHNLYLMQKVEDDS